MFKHPHVEGHWHTLIEGFGTSPLEFYELVKANIARREIPDLKISVAEWKESGVGSGKRIYLRVSREHLNFDICAAPFGTGYFFSWWLARIPQVLLDLVFLFGCFLAGGFVFTVLARVAGSCIVVILAPTLLFGGPFALGAYVRYRDTGLEPTVLSMPITGFIYRLFFRPDTYFNEDTAIVFRDSVHKAVVEAIDAVTSAQGVRGLPEEARQITFKSGKET
jgi:hypothetical protein